MWFQATAIGPVAAGAAIGTTSRDGVRPLERDLQGDHPAERPAGDEGETVDAERVRGGATAPGPGRAS